MALGRILRRKLWLEPTPLYAQVDFVAVVTKRRRDIPNLSSRGPPRRARLPTGFLMQLTDRFSDALTYAERLHRRQTRKATTSPTSPTFWL